MTQLLLSLPRDLAYNWLKPRTLFYTIKCDKETPTTPHEISKVLSRLPFPVRQCIFDELEKRNNTWYPCRKLRISNIWTRPKKNATPNENPADILLDCIVYLTPENRELHHIPTLVFLLFLVSPHANPRKHQHGAWTGSPTNS